MSKSVKTFQKKFLSLKDVRGAVADFCRKSGFPRITVENWLDGAAPNLDNLDKIADVFGLEAWELIKPEHEPTAKSLLADALTREAKTLSESQLTMLIAQAKILNGSVDAAEFLKSALQRGSKRGKD